MKKSSIKLCVSRDGVCKLKTISDNTAFCVSVEKGSLTKILRCFGARMSSLVLPENYISEASIVAYDDGSVEIIRIKEGGVVRAGMSEIAFIRDYQEFVVAPLLSGRAPNMYKYFDTLGTCNVAINVRNHYDVRCVPNGQMCLGAGYYFSNMGELSTTLYKTSDRDHLVDSSASRYSIFQGLINSLVAGRDILKVKVVGDNCAGTVFMDGVPMEYSEEEGVWVGRINESVETVSIELEGECNFKRFECEALYD